MISGLEIHQPRENLSLWEDIRLMEEENQGHLMCVVVSVAQSVYARQYLFCFCYTRSKNLIFERL